MAAIEDHAYLKLCAELASCLSISLASARRRVEIAASQDGVTDFASRKVIVERLLKEAQAQPKTGEGAPAFQLDQLLEAMADEENFMIED